jgi:hypothetical protein
MEFKLLFLSVADELISVDTKLVSKSFSFSASSNELISMSVDKVSKFNYQIR